MADVTGTFYEGEAFIGYKAELRVGQADGSPETFTAIADVTIVTPGALTTGKTQKTHLRSPNRHHEYLFTIRDSEPFVLVGNYRPSHGSHSMSGGDGFAAGRSLPALHQNVTEANFELEVFPDAGSPGIIVSLERFCVTRYQIGGIQLEEKVDFTAELSPSHDWSSGLP